MKKRTAITAVIFAAVMAGCRSTQNFDDLGAEAEKEKPAAKSSKKERAKNRKELEDWAYEERLKEVDIENTVIYVEKPVYYPSGEKSDRPALTGKAAARESTKQAEQEPSRFTGGTMEYDYDPDFTYEVYCQPYRVTDIILEPGEQCIEMPFLSEEKVWEIGAGVSREGGTDTQHFFLKPSYSGLVTSFILITDRRVYHLLLKSFKDCYMTQIRWRYPRGMPFHLKDDAMRADAKITPFTAGGVDPQYLSFDYKMTYPAFRKPYWLPKRVYDDGRRTYIAMDETVLHMATPVLFNKRNEMINYWTDKNLIVINNLIEKVTMRIGWQKVVIKKKSYKEEDKVKIPSYAEKEEAEKKEMLHTVGYIKKEEPKKEEKKKGGIPAEANPNAQVQYDVPVQGQGAAQ